MNCCLFPWFLLLGRAHRAGPVESNLFQRTVGFPNERATGFRVMLDAEELVTMRCERVECLK